MLNFDNPFQAALIALFIVFAVAGVAIFAVNPSVLTGGNPASSGSASVSVWGTINESAVANTLQSVGVNTPDSDLTVNYKEFSEDEIRSQLVNALARDEGPDALLIPHTHLLQFDEFLISVSAEAYSPRKFRNNFIEGGEIFMQESGIKALPFAVDPLVMYWNRDMLTQTGFVSPPDTWADMNRYTQRITETGDGQRIDQSAVAMGTANNIRPAPAILSSLIMQTGNSITGFRDNAGRFTSTLTDNQAGSQGAEAALRQYTQFANPASEAYSWNETFQSARRAFIGSQTAMYFDFGTAIDDVRARNPNLNFDVTTIPQRSNGKRRTYAKIYGLGILDTVSKARQARVFSVLQRVTGPQVSQALLAETNLAPAHKQVVSSAQPDQAYKSTLLNAAVTARGWIAPNPQQADRIFNQMINNVVSGQSEVAGAVSIADSALDKLLEENQQE